jgi:hypothetical protein
MREGLFTGRNKWACDCSSPVSGFPGCDNLEHFVIRATVAITDHHQVEGTRELQQTDEPYTYGKRRRKGSYISAAAARSARECMLTTSCCSPRSLKSAEWEDNRT